MTPCNRQSVLRLTTKTTTLLLLIEIIVVAQYFCSQEMSKKDSVAAGFSLQIWFIIAT